VQDALKARAPTRSTRSRGRHRRHRDPRQSSSGRDRLRAPVGVTGPRERFHITSSR
jgi:hypothetical protein